MRAAFRFVIRIYQLALSPLLRSSACRFTPSCSHYADEAIATHGVTRGSWLTVKRIARCHPFGVCGHDPVPPSFTPAIAEKRP